LDTGYADAHTNWIVCGGSGYSLRRQRQEGTDLCEGLSDLNLGEGRTIARSLQFVGRSGQGFQKRRPYSFLRIDVKPGTPPQFVVRPFVSEWYERGWKDYAIEPFVLE
jgi:hypothetical protein